MSREWQYRVQDVLDAIARIERYIGERSGTELLNDELRVDAVIRNLAIIGEAIRHIPEDIQTRYASVPWIDIRNMRNILTHVYFGVDLSIVWDTCVNDLPSLKSAMEEILQDSGN